MNKATESDRENLNGAWISARLVKRGDQKRLADALGLDNDKMSKTIKDIRAIQANEVIPLLEFFGYTVLPPDDELSALIAKLRQLDQASLDVVQAAALGLSAPLQTEQQE